jgi:hypothetical protein
VPGAAPIALRTRRGVVDVAIGLAETQDAEAALEALLAKLDDAAALLDRRQQRHGPPGRGGAHGRYGDRRGVTLSRRSGPPQTRARFTP